MVFSAFFNRLRTFPRTCARIGIALVAICMVSGGFAQDEEKESESEEEALVEQFLIPLRWTGGAGVWTNPENWNQGKVPESIAKRLVEVRVPAEITFDRSDQRLLGGLKLGSLQGPVVLDLAGHDLILRGGEFSLGLGEQGGKLRRGGIAFEGAVSWKVGCDKESTSASQFVLEDVLLKTGGLEKLVVAETGSNRRSGSTLDLSKARVENGLFAVGAEIVVGRYLYPEYNRSIVNTGKLILPGNLQILRCKDLVVGRNSRYWGEKKVASATGLVEFSSELPVALEVRSLLGLGMGDNASGRIMRIPPKSSLQVGSVESPGFVRIGVRDREQGHDLGNPAEGEMLMENATIRIVASEMRVGHNLYAGGSADGKLLFQAGSQTEIDCVGKSGPLVFLKRNFERVVISDVEDLLARPILHPGALIVGWGIGAVGELELGSGNLRVGSAYVGSRHAGSAGVIRAENTKITVREKLAIGASGRMNLSGTASLAIEALEAEALSIEGGAKLAFSRESPGTLLTWQGNHETFLKQCLERKAIEVNTSVGSAVVSSEGGFTRLDVVP